MRIHLLALEMSLSENVCVEGGRRQERMFSCDAVLLLHMASKWKRWASCRFSRSSAFWTHTNTHTEKHTQSGFFGLTSHITISNVIFQLVLQWWIHRICHEWVDFVVLAAWPVAHLISSILHFGNVMSAGNVSKRYQLLGRKRNKFTD